MADDEAKPPAALTETATRETRGYRVLVVEDEALIRLDIVETLEDAGYNVVGQAGDGEKAVELADELGPDLMAYVVKPFSPADLVPAVEIALSRNQEIKALEKEVSNLTEQFETRKRVDRAKGLLEAKMGLTEPEAFRWIQKTSMDRRLTMREVADAVIEQVGSQR